LNAVATVIRSLPPGDVADRSASVSPRASVQPACRSVERWALRNAAELR
jgi:hypothetical protein